MKTTSFAVVVAAAASLVSAQNFSGEPACAIPCLSSAIEKVGCGLDDQACQCGTGMAPIQTAVTPCLISKCNPSDLAVAASVGSKLCADYSASATAGSATANVEPSNTSASASASASQTEASLTIQTETTVHTSVAPPLTTGPSTDAAPSNGTTGGLKTSGTPTPGAPSSTSSTGAAPTLIAGIGSFIGLVAGVVAVL